MAFVRDKYVKQEILEITSFIIFGLVMAIIIPIFIGFALGGFAESFISGRPLQFGDFVVTYMIYYIMIVVALIGLPILKIREMIITSKGEHPANQSDPKLISVAYIHDPEQDGMFYNLTKGKGMKWSLSMFRMFMIFGLFFGGVGIIQVLTNFSFVGIPQMPFQITAFGEVFFSAEPPAFAETMMAIFVFSLLMGLNGWLSSKFRWGKIGYWTMGLLVCLVVGGLWMGYHSIVYGSSEKDLLATFIFGFGGSFLTLAFGSWIPWWSWHFFNNIFVKLSQLTTVLSEDVILFSGIIWLFVFISHVSAEFWLARRGKRISSPEIPE